MPDSRKHRGPHPADRELFASDQVDKLRTAVTHLSWLLSRDYAEPSAIALVGNRFQLQSRQRDAVRRASCSDQQRLQRLKSHVATEQLSDNTLHIDGFNLITTIEAALGGGVIFCGRDGCYRDASSMHGNYRKVAETRPAIEAIGQTLAKLNVSCCRWYLDKPVSNSGRLCQVIREISRVNGWNWEAQLENDPDAVLSHSGEIVVSADSMILDAADNWFNLARHVIDSAIQRAWLVRLAFTDT